MLRPHALTVFVSAFLATAAISCSSTHSKTPAIASTRPTNADQPPPAAREFRAAWVATVGNIDWPSRPGLSTEQQQQEILQILNRASALNLNAIVLQVRTTADALYDSKLEPWSAFLTGTQGKAPDPYYDPLRFWIEQAHARGIELHAWFNPFRTKYTSSKVVDADNHITKTHPELVKSYGKMGWMDPGEQAAQDHSFAVFMDVVERYDVDGIHIDDYFYPYPEPVNPDDKKDKREIPFPDDASFQKYKDNGGALDRADWRRENINKLIKRVYEGIKQRKKYVKFGISPFGIPRPGLPGIEYVKGFDQYEKLYADAVLWLQNGWCDYFAPQLYWKIGAPNQPYLGLLQWWTAHNPHQRNIYGGLFTSRIDWSDTSWQPDEILGQIMITRLTEHAGGNIHFSMIALDQNRKKMGDVLRDGLYAQPALVPASPWLDSSTPTAPSVVKVDRAAPSTVLPPMDEDTDPAVAKPATTKPFYPLATQPAVDPALGGVRIAWTPGSDEHAWLWAVYYLQGGEWKLKIVPGVQKDVTIRDSATAGPATRVAVSAVDRCGNESGRTAIDTGFKKSPG